MAKIDLMQIKVNTEGKQEILKQLESRVSKGQKSFIVTPYSEFFYYSIRNYKFREALNASDFSLPDGIAVLWLAHYLSIPLTFKNYYLKILQALWQLKYSLAQIVVAPKKIRSVIHEKITGADFFWDLINLANKKKLRVFLLGGFGNTPELVSKKIRQKYPDLEIEYSNKGPESSGMIDQINQFKIDILFVAYGPVRQEIWIHQNLNELSAKIIIGVGGTFDYVAGKRSTPPRYIRNSGFEWLYRLITQPHRFKRIWNATYGFLLAALRHKVFSTMPFHDNVVGVIINKANKVLIGLRNTNRTIEAGEHWQLPQGGIDKNESKEEGVLREMWEEMGLTELKILGKADKTYQYQWHHGYRPLLWQRKKYRGQTQTIFFLQLTQDQKIKFNDEFAGYKWIDIPELGKYIHPVRQQMLKIVLDNIGKYIS